MSAVLAHAMPVQRCVCGALTWDSDESGAWCMTCGLPEGATDEHIASLVNALWPPSGVARPPRRHYPAGPPLMRILQLLSQPSADYGLTIVDLAHRAALSMDEARVAVTAGLDRGQISSRESKWHTRAGERFAPATRYRLRR